MTKHAQSSKFHHQFCCCSSYSINLHRVTQLHDPNDNLALYSANNGIIEIKSYMTTKFLALQISIAFFMPNLSQVIRQISDNFVKLGPGEV